MRRGKQPKFGRERNQRNAFYKSLATALIDHDRILTTKTRAKAVSSYVERLITHAKKGSVASRRLLATHVGTAAVKKLVDTIAPKFQARQGGYTRVIRASRRTSDGSPMAFVEFVS